MLDMPIGDATARLFEMAPWLAIIGNMAIARKGRRCIVVDDRTYHWSVNDRRTHDNLLMVAIALEGRDGTTLLVEASGEAQEGSSRYSQPVVTPAKIAQVIRLAQSSGWSPDKPGKPYLMALPKGL
jgi:hypothetical protein